MSLLSPLGLLALLAVPAILVLHLYRRRPLVRRVSAAFLFATGVPDSDGAGSGCGSAIEPALVLELLAAIAIALWLAEPRFGISAEPRTLVLVIDDSASMLALGGDGRSACDRARGAAVAALDALPDDTRFAVVRSGARPAVLARSQRHACRGARRAARVVAAAARPRPRSISPSNSRASAARCSCSAMAIPVRSRRAPACSPSARPAPTPRSRARVACASAATRRCSAISRASVRCSAASCACSVRGSTARAETAMNSRSIREHRVALGLSDVPRSRGTCRS